MQRSAWTVLVIVIALLALGAWWATRGADAGPMALVTPPTRAATGDDRTGAELVAATSAPAGRGAVEPAATADAIVPDTAPASLAALDRTPGTATLEGTVLDEDGDTITARVELVHPVTGETHATETALGYRFDGLEPGTWWARVWAEMRSPACERLELEPGSNRKDFLLSAMRSIEVHIETSSGEPLASALEASGQRSGTPHVFATLEPPGTERLDGNNRLGIGWFEEGRYSRPSTRSSVDPPWGVAGWPELDLSLSWVGTLHLSVDQPVYVAAANLPNVLDAVRVEPGTTNVTLHVDVEDLRPAYASLYLRLAAADTGEPIAKSWFVRLVSWTTQTSSMPTSDDGYRFERVSPGRYELHVAQPGFIGQMRTVELAPGEDRDAGTIELERIEPTTGLVLDPLGRGATAEVEIGPARAATGYVLGQSSDEQGRFSLAMALKEGTELRVRPTALAGFAGQLASRIVRVDPGRFRDVVVQLERCSRVVLRPEGPACMGGTRYSVVDEHGSRYARGVFRDAGPIAIELPVGWYEIVLIDGSGVERRLAVQLGERPAVLDVGAL